MEPGTLALVAVLAMAGVKVTIGGYLLAMGYVKCGGDANGGRSCLGFGRKDGDAGEEARARLTEEGAEESASGKPKEASEGTRSVGARRAGAARGVGVVDGWFGSGNVQGMFT